MSSNDNNINSNKAKPGISYLILRISPTSELLTIEATVTNSHPVASFSILTWDTPLCRLAMLQGIFSINRLGDENNRMFGLLMRLKRKLPPPQSQLVEIGPGSSSSKQFKISLKDFPLESGQVYRIRAAGYFGHVWPLKVDEITDKELQTLVGRRRCRFGRFASNEAEFIAP